MRRASRVVRPGEWRLFVTGTLLGVALIELERKAKGALQRVVADPPSPESVRDVLGPRARRSGQIDQTPTPVVEAPALPAPRTKVPGRRQDSPRSAFAGSRLWVQPVLLAGVVYIGMMMRVWQIDRLGFNSDEAVYAGQGAALVGIGPYDEYFSVFRAHPLFLPLLLGGLFQAGGVDDRSARLLVALVFGLGCILLTYLMGRDIFGNRVGIGAALIVAVVPYHVLVSRQVLVDVPFAFFSLLTLWLLVRFDRAPTPWRLALVAGAAGLAFLSKEVGILLVVVLAVYLIVARHRLPRFGLVALSGAILTVLVAAFPLSRMIFAPRFDSYFLWQLQRPANHGPGYFAQIVVEFGSSILAALIVVGLLVLAVRRSRAALLLGLWLMVFLVFFQVWPTKLFPYLYVVFPALCIAAALGIDELAHQVARIGSALTPRRLSGMFTTRRLSGALFTAGLAALSLFLASSAIDNLRRGPAGVTGPVRYDIEIQDFAGGREVGLWAATHTPENSTFLTIGPSVGNLLRFYGHRQSVALSVSPDPRRRNPAYVPVPNPDLMIRRLGVQYAVWDVYSAHRSSFNSARLRGYVRKYHGQLVYGVWQWPDGEIVIGAEPVGAAEPRILVYDLVGGDQLPGAQ